MTKKQLWIKSISFVTLPVAILSVVWHPSTFTALIENLQSTTLSWIIQGSILGLFLYNRRLFFDSRNVKNFNFVKWYLLWNCICIFRGLFVAENYWDWKGLIINTMALLLPIVAYMATNKVVFQSIIRYYLKYTLPLFVIVALLISTDAYGFYLIPMSYLILFYPAMSKGWKMVLAVCTLFVLFIDMDARSNIIKFIVPVLLLTIYYFRRYFSIKLLNYARLTFLVLPIFLFVLAISGIFNVFSISSYIKGKQEIVKTNSDGERVAYNLKADTRTFLYLEVLNTAQQYDFWWTGRSPARGNKSDAFGADDLTGRGERLTNEVAVLNIFTWTGIVGLLLYFLVFYKASELAINNSRNIYSKMLGILIAFRWAYSWVEDVNDFSLNYFMLWLMIGLCFAKSFRTMTDQEVAAWIRGCVSYRLKPRYPLRYGHELAKSANATLPAQS